MKDSRMDLLVTIDIEGNSGEYECVNDLYSMLNEIDFGCTLFVTPDVVKNRTELVEDWIKDDHEVGLHIHPRRMTGGSDWLTEYKENEIEDMVINGTLVFEDELSYTPDIFRAGRWAYSNPMLKALGSQGYSIDASLRPREETNPYRRYGVKEVPHTVYSNVAVKAALKPFTVESIPFHADGWLSKSRLPRLFFHSVTLRKTASQPDYFMTSFHDYDVEATTLRDRITSYIKKLKRKATPITINETV